MSILVPCRRIYWLVLRTLCPRIGTSWIMWSRVITVTTKMALRTHWLNIILNIIVNEDLCIHRGCYYSFLYYLQHIHVQQVLEAKLIVCRSHARVSRDLITHSPSRIELADYHQRHLWDEKLHCLEVIFKTWSRHTLSNLSQMWTAFQYLLHSEISANGQSRSGRRAANNRIRGPYVYSHLEATSSSPKFTADSLATV